MTYESRIVCYFDILGFKDAVCSGRLSAEAISKLFAEVDEVMDEYGGDLVNGTYFSDSFAVSIKMVVGAKKQLDFIVAILEKLIEYRLLARGGVAYGDLVHDDAKIFGPALVKAVELEKKAFYPRIVVDESLRGVTMPTIGNAKIDYLGFMTDFIYVKNDREDGMPYIDYVSSILKRVRREESENYMVILDEMVADGLRAIDERIVRKYEWLRDKINSAKVELGFF